MTKLVAPSLFGAFSVRELSTLHHALRMLAKYENERAEAERLADHVWAEIQDRARLKDEGHADPA